jgi:hypothetical protein
LGDVLTAPHRRNLRILQIISKETRREDNIKMGFQEVG